MNWLIPCSSRPCRDSACCKPPVPQFGDVGLADLCVPGVFVTSQMI